jgi:hypothetical protein
VIVVFAANGFQQIKDEIRVENKTNSLSIESVTKISKQANPKRFRITVKNNSGKNIVAYSFQQIDDAMPKDSYNGIETNGAMIGWMLEPGKTDSTLASSFAAGEVLMILNAVLFEDGTGEGEAAQIRKLQNNRDGVRLVYQKAVSLTRKLTAANEISKIDVLAQALEKELEAELQKTPADLKSGFVDGKNLIITDLKELADKSQSAQSFQPREAIEKTILKFEGILAKL